MSPFPVLPTLVFYSFLLFLQIGCGFSADSQKGPSGEGEGLRAEGWAAGISNLDSGPEMAFFPQIAVEGDPADNDGAGSDDSSASAIAVWVKLEDPDTLDTNPQQVYRVYAARAVGAAWAAAQLIDTGSASYYGAWAPKVSMDDLGNAVAVWQQYDGTAQRVWTRRFTAGAWAVTDAGSGCGSGGNNGPDDGICRLNDSTDFTFFNAAAPAIAVEPDGGGTAMAVWSQYYQANWAASFAGAQESVRSLAVFNDALYLGQGDGAGDGDAYVLFNNVWSVARDFGAGIERVSSLAADQANVRLYAGLGTTAGDGDVWQCNPTTTGNTSLCETGDWTGPLSTATLDPGGVIEEVTALTVFNGTVYAGLCCTNGEGDVFYYNGVSWVLSRDFGATIGRIGALAVDAVGNKLYAGIGEDVGGAAGEGDDVFVCDPTLTGVATLCDAADWSVLPDMDGVATNIEAVTSLAVFNSKVYAGACCTAGADDQVYVYDPVGNTWNLSRSFAGAYEAVRSLADYNGSLYAGLGDTNSTDGDIYRCFPANDSAGPLGTTTCDNSAAEWPVSLDSAVAGASLALAVYAGNLYVGQGTAAAAGDVYVFVAGWKTVARQFSAGAWATSEVAGNVCASGADDGICMIAGGAALTPASSPVVAMDASGRAIAAFVRLVAATCFAPPTVDVDASAANRSITLVSFTCYDSALWVNQFDVALTPDWGGVTGAINIDPNAPVDGDPTATDSPFMCFQNSDADVPSGNLQGFSTACQNVSQPRIAMDRAGVAIVTAKVWWQEDETSQDNTDTNCSNGVNIDGERICNDAGQHTSPPGGPPACLGGIGDGYGAIPVCAADEWSGNAIAVRRYDGAGWTAADWPTAAPSLQFLYAHSNQPSEAADLGGSERFYNCPAAGRVLTDTSRFLVECDLNAPQITMGDTDNNPATVTDVALVVWERFDGTNHDVYADCFSQTAVTTCGGAAVAGWRSSFAVPEPGTATNDNYTASYFVLNDIAASRMAFSPQVALDATGNGLAVWTQRDVNQWRVYGMRFQAGTGFVAASRVPIDSLGSDPSCSSGACMYSNPVLSMEWVNAGNAANCPAGVSCGSAWALMLDTELFGGALLPPILNVRILAHQWTPP